MQTINIRTGVFETNSSSTHSICVAKNVDIYLPKEIHFEFGSFGSEYKKLDTIKEKASFLYTAFFNIDDIGGMNKIFLLLNKMKINIKVEKPRYESGYIGPTNGGYIHDMTSEIHTFLKEITKKDNLLNYLFSPLSYVVSGPESLYEEYQISEQIDYEADIY